MSFVKRGNKTVYVKGVDIQKSVEGLKLLTQLSNERCEGLLESIEGVVSGTERTEYLSAHADDIHNINMLLLNEIQILIDEIVYLKRHGAKMYYNIKKECE